MKSYRNPLNTFLSLSPPVWGAWVEIVYPLPDYTVTRSPPVWGAWVEMQTKSEAYEKYKSRPPCGGRGLKSDKLAAYYTYVVSPPVWGAWVEIPLLMYLQSLARVAPRVGGVG